MLSGVKLERSKILSKNIKRYLEINGLSQAQLARRAGIKLTTLNNWLRNETYPKQENLIKLAQTLGCSVPDLTESESYLDERKKFLTVGLSLLVNYYSNDKEFQKFCDYSLKLHRENRLHAYALKLYELVESSENLPEN